MYTLRVCHQQYIFDETDYSNPARKPLKIAAVAAAKSKIGLNYRIFRFFLKIIWTGGELHLVYPGCR